MRLGVIIFTLGAAFVAGGVTAPATDAVTPPHVLFGAWVQQGAPPTHAPTWIGCHTVIRAVSYFDGISPKGYDFRVETSPPSFDAWQTMQLG